MQNVRRMHEINGYQKLIHDELDHLFSDFHLGLNEPSEIKFHEFHDQVDFIECGWICDGHDALQSDNVLMIEELYDCEKKKLHKTLISLSTRRVSPKLLNNLEIFLMATGWFVVKFFPEATIP